MPALDWEGPGGKGPCLRLPQAIRASARVRGAAGVCAYFAQAPPPGGNGGGAAASGSAAGDDLYVAGMGVPATPGNFFTKPTLTAGTKRKTWTRRGILAYLGNSALAG